MACGSRRRSFSGKVVRLLREGGSAYSDLRRLPSVTAASSFRRNRDASAYCRIEVPEQSGTNIMLSSVMSDAASRRVDSSNPLRAKSDRTSDSDVNSGISRGNCKVTTNRTSSSRSHRTIGGSSFQRKSDVYGAVHGRGRSFDLGTVLQRVTALVSSKLFVFMLLIVGLGAADDSISSGGGLRPQWIPLVRGAGTEADKAILELFGSSEVLQMYHLQATAQLYEQGGLNHDMSFFLTAVAFYSLERPDVKVSMAYHPTNMTISLLPVISEDGRELRWDHQSATTSYVMDLDQAYWTGASYMGETTGAFFSYAVEFSADYHQAHPRYQPFSVYEDYPGRAFLTASSCDEYVWELLSAAQERGVRLTPALMPQKYKIVIYSQTEPETILLDGSNSRSNAGGSGTGFDDDDDHDGDGDGTPEEGVIDGGDGGGDRGNETDSSASDRYQSTDSWRSSSALLGGDDDGSGDGVGSDGDRGSSDSGHHLLGHSSAGFGDGIDGNGTASGAKGDAGNDQQGDNQKDEAEGQDGRGEGRWRGRKQRRRTLLWSARKALEGTEGPVQSTPAPGSTANSVAAAAEVGVPSSGADAGQGGGGGEGVVSSTSARDFPEDVITIRPTSSPTIGEPTAAMDDWQQLVAYYQSLQLCLQERKFSFVTSLKDFAQYFDCLDDFAFISVGPHEYYKVNLTSTKLDHISLPEEFPEMPKRAGGFTVVDSLLAIWIFMILACGIHGMLWQAAVMQHWFKVCGYGQDEENVTEFPAAPSPVRQHPPMGPPSFTRQITTEYLRLGQRVFGKADDYSAISCPSGVDDNAEISDSLSDSLECSEGNGGIDGIDGGAGDGDSDSGNNGLEMANLSNGDKASSRNGAVVGSGADRKRRGTDEESDNASGRRSESVSRRDNVVANSDADRHESRDPDEGFDDEEGEAGTFVGNVVKDRSSSRSASTRFKHEGHSKVDSILSRGGIESGDRSSSSGGSGSEADIRWHDRRASRKTRGVGGVYSRVGGDVGNTGRRSEISRRRGGGGARDTDRWIGFAGSPPRGRTTAAHRGGFDYDYEGVIGSRGPGRGRDRPDNDVRERLSDAELGLEENHSGNDDAIAGAAARRSRSADFGERGGRGDAQHEGESRAVRGGVDWQPLSPNVGGALNSSSFV